MLADDVSDSRSVLGPGTRVQIDSFCSRFMSVADLYACRHPLLSLGVTELSLHACRQLLEYSHVIAHCYVASFSCFSSAAERHKQHTARPDACPMPTYLQVGAASESADSKTAPDTVVGLVACGMPCCCDGQTAR